MSKIDEIKEKTISLVQCSDDCLSIEADKLYSDICDSLEQLRPFIELGELIYKNQDNVRITDDIAKDVVSFIKKIQEQK